MTEALVNNQIDASGPVITAHVDLDDDLKHSFNLVAGNAMGQLIILQLQSNRRLNQLIEILERQTFNPSPPIQVEGKEEKTV